MKIHTSTRRLALVVIILIVAPLIVPTTVQPANPPDDVRTMASARDALLRSHFMVYTTGSEIGEYILLLSDVDPFTGAIRGRYSLLKDAGSGPPNVSGIIAVAAGGRLIPTTTSISFAVSNSVGVPKKWFAGAIRFASADHANEHTFIAGTFNLPLKGGRTGPYPFTARQDY